MTSCLMVGAALLALTAPDFTLEWQHSVEKLQWRESWAVASDGLYLTMAAVKGSGAGMEPGDGARLVEGWWVWHPDLAPVPSLTLAMSGATGVGWTLCAGAVCQELAETGGTLILRPCTKEEWTNRAGP